MSAALVVRLDRSGAVEWARSYGRAWHNQFDHVEVGSDGSIWATGIAANGFHPTLPRRPDPSGAGDDERPIIAKLTPAGEIEWVKDAQDRPADLLATDRGVLLAFQSGRVLRFPFDKPGPETLLELDLAEARRASGTVGSDELRLDPAGLWVLQSKRAGKMTEAQLLRYAWGATKPTTTSLGETTISVSPGWCMVAHAGDVYLAGTEASPDRFARWFRVSPTGRIMWRWETTLGPMSSKSYSLEMSHMAVQGDRVLTLFTHGDDEASLAGLDLEPTGVLAGAARGAVVLELSATAGKPTAVHTVSDACAAASVGGSPPDYAGFGRTSGRLVAPVGSSQCEEPGAAFAFEWQPSTREVGRPR